MPIITKFVDSWKQYNTTMAKYFRGKRLKWEWFAIKGKLLRCMNELVPKKETMDSKQPPWMKKRGN